eukprot:2122533-Pyramimonas_sp.AAC.1
MHAGSVARAVLFRCGGYGATGASGQGPVFCAGSNREHAGLPRPCLGPCCGCQLLLAGAVAQGKASLLPGRQQHRGSFQASGQLHHQEHTSVVLCRPVQDDAAVAAQGRVGRAIEDLSGPFGRV